MRGARLVPIVHAFTDHQVPDRDRRRSLFAGDLFVYNPRPSTLALAAAARALLEQVLGPDPAFAQQRCSEPEFSALFNAAARNLSQIVLQLAGAVAVDLGCDAATTFVGAPSLVATTGMGFLAHGLGVPQHPHRDTWYAATLCQLNWWVPVYDLGDSASLAFHPVYWRVPVRNTSASFVFDDWYERHRMGRAAPPAELSDQPRALDPIELTPEIRISCPAGGVILSSVAQLYSVVPNETVRIHFGVHFKTLSYSDLALGHGATNLDAEAQGTSLSTFVRCSDFTPIPDELTRLHVRGGSPSPVMEDGPGQPS